MKAVRAVLSGVAISVLALGQNPDFQAAERAILRLQPAAFPTLPQPVVRGLQRRACTIPQESFSGSKAATNVISGEFTKPGQTDWAVLCSREGVSSVLIFRNGLPENPAELAPVADAMYLQGLGDGKIGFSRGISAVGDGFIREHYQAYGGPKPPPIDHQGINDAFLGKASVVHYCFEGEWRQLAGSD